MFLNYCLPTSPVSSCVASAPGYFIEIFAGSALLTAAVLSLGGVCGHPWHIKFDNLFDVLRYGYRIFEWIRAGTFSFARSPALRTREHPWGRPDASAAERALINDGNVFLKFSLHCIQLAIEFNCLYMMENPWSSLLWFVPEVRQLHLKGQGSITGATFAQFGVPVNKTLGFISNIPGINELDQFQIVTPPPFLKLRGKAIVFGQARWLTSTFEAYPAAMCRALGSIIVEALSHRQRCHLENRPPPVFDFSLSHPWPNFEIDGVWCARPFSVVSQMLEHLPENAALLDSERLIFFAEVYLTDNVVEHFDVPNIFPPLPLLDCIGNIVQPSQLQPCARNLVNDGNGAWSGMDPIEHFQFTKASPHMANGQQPELSEEVRKARDFTLHESNFLVDSHRQRFADSFFG